MVTLFVGAGYTGARVVKRLPEAVALGRALGRRVVDDVDRHRAGALGTRPHDDAVEHVDELGVISDHPEVGLLRVEDWLRQGKISPVVDLFAQ